jgi:hypothetical protein
MTLTLDINEDMEILVYECGSGKMSGLEDAFRREVSAALDISVSSVIIDCFRTPSAGCTKVCALHSLHVQRLQPKIPGPKSGFFAHGSELLS